MTNFDCIKAMSVDDMALMFHTLCKEIDQKWIDALKSEDITFDSICLADEIQIAIHKQYLESEVEKG